MKRLALLPFLLVAYTLSLVCQTPSFYVKRDTWQETVRLSREALQRSLAPARAVERSMLGPWYVIGPFASATRTPFYDAFPPEHGIHLTQHYGKLKWMKRPDWKNGQVIDLLPTPWSATYLYRTITARRDTSIIAYLGSDDGIKVWVNGRLALLDSSYRGAEPNQDTVQMPLHQGKNSLLMKISNGEGAHGFYMSLAAGNPDVIWNAVEKDFSQPEQLREIYWERSDSIWDAEWTPGDVSELGRRYARAYRTAVEELGIDHPEPFPQVRTVADLQKARAMYLALRHRELTDIAVLTPHESPAPKINGPSVFGARPGHPFLYAIPASGERPMTFYAHGLPNGLVLDSANGQITGAVADAGEYKVVLKATNSRGTVMRDFRIIIGDRIALTPPLGWNSWNCFAEAVSDEKVRLAADALVKSGLVQHGWTYINIDDCWMVKPGSTSPEAGGVPRDDQGRIHTNAKFPDMHALANYVHARGLKLGIYSSPGPLTCAGYTGSYQHELEDARQYAAWGVDYLKYDWCSYGRINRDTVRAAYERPYRVMRAALDSVDRDIVYSLCQYGMKQVWIWGDSVGGNCWRTTGDIVDTWKSMTDIGFNQNGLERYAGPGHWNDPDMLVVGWVGWGPSLRPTRLTPSEQLTHITLWSMLCAPLLIGCDLTRLDDFTYSLLSNDEVLEVNQDPLGRQAHRVAKTGDVEVWAKEMEDGSRAVGLFNRGPKKTAVTVQWPDIGLGGSCQVRDLWRQKGEGSFTGHYTAAVPRHGAVLIRVTQEKAAR